MEIDINIVAHDLLWRSMSLRTKREYRDAYAAGRDAIVEKEVQRLVDGGYIVRSGDGINLTPAGEELYKKMTSLCKKSE